MSKAIDLELVNAYNECVIKMFEKKRTCSDKCKLCKKEREDKV
jgi:hypothetical protein